MNAIEQAIQALAAVIGNSTIQANHPTTCEIDEDALTALQSVQGEAFGYLIYDRNENTEDFARTKPDQINPEHEEVVAVYLHPPAQPKVSDDVLESLWRHTKGVDPETGEAWLTPRMLADAKNLEAVLTARGKGE